MTFKIDYLDGVVYEWEVTENGATSTKVEEYFPTIYTSGDSRAALAELREFLERREGVVETTFERWRTVWRNEPEAVLRLDLAGIEAVYDIAHEIRSWGSPGEYKLYNVDFAREFRYCLENEIVPVPQGTRSLTTCTISLPPKKLNDETLTPLNIDDRVIENSETDALETLHTTLSETDPDVLILSSADLVPLLHRKAEDHGLGSFRLGRIDGWQQLAGESTYESYGRVGHSPARYNVPGRAIIDTSNSFFWGQTNLDGILDLVERSSKPIQETAWASIGNVLTSIQIREALTSGVLVPWNSWRHEKFKPLTTLHDADRGGFIFAPEVGFHEDVHELDFSSLYPSIMVTRNISPDTIRCDCHSERSDVPELGYSICDEEGFITRVLDPIIQDRQEYKTAIEATDDSEWEAELRGRSSALKWILVSCFGYQGFSNAKFGRIECHEAINAFAREILLDTKETLEDHGWEIVHGIVDSVWVRAIPERNQTPLVDVAETITDEIEIPLEYEAHYEWIAFAPRKESDEGALNRYFAKYADQDEFKKRGIEVRQRSTPSYIEDCQLQLMDTLDEHRSPEPVCDQLQVQLSELRAGRVDPAELLIKRRVSKDVDEYTHYTRNVAALDRAEIQDFDINPGENVEFVVVDDEKDSPERVRLAYESIDRYDAEFYADLLIRAAESILSPLGWDRTDIRSYLNDTDETRITAY